MRNSKTLTPTEIYPKILWYQIKKPIPTEADQKIIYNNHFKRLMEILVKKFPTASQYDITEAAVAQAEVAAEKEINKPEALMKAVVNNSTEYYKMVALIEGTDTFIQWYKK